MATSLLDLPLDVLDAIAGHPVLKSKDHANLARTCTALRRIVRFTRLCFPPMTGHHGVHFSIRRLAAALRCATARNPQGGIVLEEDDATFCRSFTDEDLDLLSAVSPDLFDRVERIIFHKVAWDGCRCTPTCMLRVHENLPKCTLEIRDIMMSTYANWSALAKAHGSRRFLFHNVTLHGSARTIAAKLADVREPMHLQTLTIDVRVSEYIEVVTEDVVEAVRACCMTANTLIVNAGRGVVASPLSAAIGRLARRTLIIRSAGDMGIIASVLRAPRTVTRIEISAEAGAPAVKILGVELWNARGRGPALEAACLPAGTENDVSMAVAIKSGLVRSCVWT